MTGLVLEIPRQKSCLIGLKFDEKMKFNSSLILKLSHKVSWESKGLIKHLRFILLRKKFAFFLRLANFSHTTFLWPKSLFPTLACCWFFNKQDNWHLIVLCQESDFSNLRKPETFFACVHSKGKELAIYT